MKRVNSPFTPTEEMKPDPDSPERYAMERMLKEWPDETIPSQAKALMFLALLLNDDCDGPLGKMTYQIERIADALEKMASEK